MNCKIDFTLQLMPSDPERVCEYCFRPLRLTKGICLGHEATEDWTDGLSPYTLEELGFVV